MKSFFLLTASLILTQLSTAQENVLNNLKGKAKGKIEAQDFNTTRNNRENLQNKKSSKQSETLPASAPAPAPVESIDSSSASTGTYRSEYTFTANLTYQMEAGQKKEVNTITYFIGEGYFKAAMSQDMSMIFDTENHLMITIMEASKSAMVMSSDKMSAYSKKPENSESKNYKITRTGKTKTILGYTCEEIIAESDDSKSIMWIAKDTGIDVSTAFANYFAANMKATSEEAYQGGLLMEMTSFNKKGEQTAHMLMTNLSKELVKFMLGAYKITTL